MTLQKSFFFCVKIKMNNALQLMILQQLTYSSNDNYIDESIPTYPARLSDVYYYEYSDDEIDDVLPCLHPPIARSDIVSFCFYDGMLLISTKEAILCYSIWYMEWNEQSWFHFYENHYKLRYSNADFKNVEFARYGIFKYNDKWYYPTTETRIGKSEDEYEFPEDSIITGDNVYSIVIFKEYGTLEDNERLLYYDGYITIISSNGKTRIIIDDYSQKEYAINVYNNDCLTCYWVNTFVLIIGTETYILNLDIINGYEDDYYIEDSAILALNSIFNNPITRIVIYDDKGRIRKLQANIKCIYISIINANSFMLGDGYIDIIMYTNDDKCWNLFMKCDDYLGDGFDINWYDTDGYDERGFDVNGNHRNGTLYDERGFNVIRKHYSGDVYDERGFDVNGIHKDTGTKYESNGYDVNGLHKDT